jgi:hypothetical protein
MGALMMNGLRIVECTSKLPTATHPQFVTHDTPSTLVCSGITLEALGVLGTTDQEVPFQATTRVALAMVGVAAVPTAVHEVALKQSTPESP